MSAISSNPPRSLCIAPLFALLFAAPAVAGNDVWYPVNPYHGKASWEQPPAEWRGTTQALPSYPRQEYPNGPNGSRVVKIILSHHDLLTAENRMLNGVLANERAAAEDLRRTGDAVYDRSQRVRWLAPLRHDSIEQYQAWVDLTAEVNRLEAHAADLRNYLERCRQFKENLRRQLSRPQPTTVVWNVRNHQNREYVPTDYLRNKAIEHLLANPLAVGTTLRLNF